MAAPSATVLPCDEDLSPEPPLVDTVNKLIQEVRRRMGIDDSLPAEQAKRQALANERRAFPSDKLLIKLAVEAYSDNPNEQIGAWNLLTVARNDAKNNRYVGVAYWNGAEQQMVVAHRGTPFKFSWDAWGALRNDFRGIGRNKVDAPQVKSAITFTNMIRDIVNNLNRKPGICVQLSITGHSLGGWLAQITTFSVKHLAPYKQGNTYYFLKNQDQSTAHHAHTVAFDSPGCKKMLMKMQSALFDRLESNCPLDDLDVTVYLSAPNLVNTWNLHIKTVYRVFIDLTEYNPSINLIDHLFFTHNKQSFLDLFVKGEKIPRQEVLTWPKLRVTNYEEYKKIFKTANKWNNFVPRPFVTGYGHRDIHYSTKPVDCNVFKMSYLSQNERKLLFGYQLRCQFPALGPLLSANGLDIGHYLQMDHQRLEIKNDHLHSNIGTKNFFKLVSLIRRCCHFYPELLNVRQVDSPDIMIGVFQQESNDFLSEISNNILDFNQNDVLHSVLTLPFNNNEDNNNKFVWVDETTFVGALKLYRATRNTELRENCLFLSFNQLQMLSKHISLQELLRNYPKLVLFIECQSDCDLEELKKLWNNFPTTTNKLILIADQHLQLIEFPGANRNQNGRGITFDSLTEKIKKIINEKEISLQNQAVQLGILGIAQNLSTAALISIGFNEPISIGKELETLLNEDGLCYIGRTLRMRGINPDIICCQKVNTDDIFVSWRVDNHNGFVNMDEQALHLNDLREVGLRVNTSSELDFRVVFVIGKTGMGKTKLFKHLALKIKTPTRWVINLDFSELVQCYVDGDSDIIDTLTKALQSRSNIEMEFFRLYSENIVLLLDGVDPVSQHKIKFESLTKKLIAHSGMFHQIWFSCRRESTYRKAIEGHPVSTTAYTLQPFHINEQRQFLQNFWSRNMDNFNERIFAKYFDELMESFHHLIRGKYEDFTRNPRILQKIGQIFGNHFQVINDSSELQNVTKYNLWPLNRHDIVEYLNESQVLKSTSRKCQLLALGSKFNSELKYLISSDEIKYLNAIKEHGDSELEQLWIFHELNEPTNQVSCFVNGSFDEYFAAQYLIDQINEPVHKNSSNFPTERHYYEDNLDELKANYEKAARNREEARRNLKREYFFTRFLKAENQIICERIELELNQKEFNKKINEYMGQFPDKISANQQFVMTKLARFYSI